jgi:saccharopine dehydrogenase (NAD+, L-lysine forming)
VSSVGAEIVPFGSWRSAPPDAYILGLEELPENDTSPLCHTHIMFAHSYKNQAGWETVLSRWSRGGGTLLDLEFLTDADGRRVATFSYYAGFAGAALALQVWGWRRCTKGDGVDFPGVKPFPNEGALLDAVREQIEAAVKGGIWPEIMVTGALGRAGSGAIDAARKIGFPDEHIQKWDIAEIASHVRPFHLILEGTSHSPRSRPLPRITLHVLPGQERSAVGGQPTSLSIASIGLNQAPCS